MADTYWPNYRTENTCRIIHKNGYSYLAMPDGTVLPKQVFCRVTNVVNERPYAIVKVFVNLDDTEDTDTVDINQQLWKDKELYGIAYEQFKNGRRERIDPTTVRVHHVNKREG
jgi:hypothetical protein